MTFDGSGLTAYVDGSYVDGAEARIPIWDHGLLYGDGIFEGMRVFDGSLFRPRDHLERLGRSARALGIELPLGTSDLLDVIKNVVSYSGLREAHVRPIVTRGAGMPTMDPSYCERPVQIVAAYPLPPILGTDPVRLLISSVVRKAPRSLGAHVKSLNYLDSIVAKQQAKAAGMHDAVMLDTSGAVAECTGANLFMISGQHLITPTTRAALPGITRRTVIELAHEHNISFEERELWPSELYTADAIFLTGSGAGIVHVAEVDGHPVQTIESEIAITIATGYRARTRDPTFIETVNYDNARPTSGE